MAMQNYIGPEYFHTTGSYTEIDQVGVCTCVKCWALIQYEYLESHTKWHEALDKGK